MSNPFDNTIIFHNGTIEASTGTAVIVNRASLINSSQTNEIDITYKWGSASVSNVVTITNLIIKS